MDQFFQYAREIEERIGLRSGYLNELLREDDWSFVIKLHAYFETCLTHAICAVLGRTELEEVIGRLDTSNNQSGKLAFARQLEILNKPERRFVATLSQLRNDLVHDASAVDFTFDSYMTQMTEDKRYQFCEALSLDEILEPLSDAGEVRIISWVDAASKVGIGFAAFLVISQLYVRSLEGDLSRELTDLGKYLVDRKMAER